MELGMKGVLSAGRRVVNTMRPDMYAERRRFEQVPEA
jgi:hypothetical protein